MSTSDSDRNEAQGHPSAEEPKDPVVRNVERRIWLEALRQVEAVDVDDDNWRIEPLPQGRIPGVFDEVEAAMAAVPDVAPDGSAVDADSITDCD